MFQLLFSKAIDRISIKDILIHKKKIRMFPSCIQTIVSWQQLFHRNNYCSNNYCRDSRQGSELLLSITNLRHSPESKTLRNEVRRNIGKDNVNSQCAIKACAVIYLLCEIT